MHEKTYKAQDN